jgi:acetylornithine aminotransferase
MARRLEGVKGIVDIRGQGLMIGIELDRPCAELVGRALADGLLINVTADTVVRLLPPLILKREEAAVLTEKLAALIRAFLA